MEPISLHKHVPTRERESEEEKRKRFLYAGKEEERSLIRNSPTLKNTIR